MLAHPEHHAVVHMERSFRPKCPPQLATQAVGEQPIWPTPTRLILQGGPIGISTGREFGVLAYQFAQSAQSAQCAQCALCAQSAQCAQFAQCA